MYMHTYVIFFSIAILFGGLLYLYYPLVKSYVKKYLHPNANVEKIKDVMRKVENNER